MAYLSVVSTSTLPAIKELLLHSPAPLTEDDFKRIEQYAESTLVTVCGCLKIIETKKGTTAFVNVEREYASTLMQWYQGFFNTTCFARPTTQFLKWDFEIEIRDLNKLQVEWLANVFIKAEEQQQQRRSQEPVFAQEDSEEEDFDFQPDDLVDYDGEECVVLEFSREKNFIKMRSKRDGSWITTSPDFVTAL